MSKNQKSWLIPIPKLLLQYVFGKGLSVVATSNLVCTLHVMHIKQYSLRSTLCIFRTLISFSCNKYAIFSPFLALKNIFFFPFRLEPVMLDTAFSWKKCVICILSVCYIFLVTKLSLKNHFSCCYNHVTWWWSNMV